MCLNPSRRVSHLRRQQGVGVESLHVGDQVVLRVDDIFHERAVEEEPVGAAVHRDALRDFAVAQPPHVGVALEEEPIQALLADEPAGHDMGPGNVGNLLTKARARFLLCGALRGSCPSPYTFDIHLTSGLDQNPPASQPRPL